MLQHTERWGHQRCFPCPGKWCCSEQILEACVEATQSHPKKHSMKAGDVHSGVENAMYVQAWIQKDAERTGAFSGGSLHARCYSWVWYMVTVPAFCVTSVGQQDSFNRCLGWVNMWERGTGLFWNPYSHDMVGMRRTNGAANVKYLPHHWLWPALSYSSPQDAQDSLTLCVSVFLPVGMDSMDCR